MKIDLKKWTTDRLETEAKIRALKDQMRASGHMVTYEEQRQLEDLKYRATQLYLVRAVLRGRCHLIKIVEYECQLGSMVRYDTVLGLEDNRSRAGGWIEEYLLPEAVQATA